MIERFRNHKSTDSVCSDRSRRAGGDSFQTLVLSRAKEEVSSQIRAGRTTVNGNSGPAVQGDRSARFVELLTSHQRDLYVYIDTLLMGDGATPDVLQDTNVALWSRIQDFDFQRPFLPWAYGFAYQRVLAFRKSCSRSRLVFNDEVLELISAGYVGDGESADSRLAALRFCIEKLGSDQTDLLHDRYVEKMSVKSLASRLSRSANQVSVQLFRIRDALGRCIEAKLAGERQ
jgi:RNA polymerase sigma-70 factor, ECF subfamily